jgi:hypothetical protein
LIHKSKNSFTTQHKKKEHNKFKIKGQIDKSTISKSLQWIRVGLDFVGAKFNTVEPSVKLIEVEFIENLQWQFCFCFLVHDFVYVGQIIICSWGASIVEMSVVITMFWHINFVLKRIFYLLGSTTSFTSFADEFVWC